MKGKLIMLILLLAPVLTSCRVVSDPIIKEEHGLQMVFEPKNGSMKK